HLMYYWGKHTGDLAASQMAATYVQNWLSIDSRTTTGPYGVSRIWPHNLTSQGSGATYAQGSQYSGYEAMDFLHTYLENAMPSLVTREVLQQMARTMQAWMFLPNFTSLSAGVKGTYRDIIGEQNRAGFTNSTGMSATDVRQTSFFTTFAFLPFISSSNTQV